MATIKSWFVPVIILVFFWMTILPCAAIEPAWKFSYGDREIGDIAVAPDGSTVVAAAGKVLLLSNNGTQLSNEPFGEIIAQSRDGSTIVSSYSSSVSSTVYLFKKKKDASGNYYLQKQWDATFPQKVLSFAVSDNGDRISFCTVSKGIYVYSGKTGKRLGYSDKFSSLIAISAKGGTISGISLAEGLRVFNYLGTTVKRYTVSMAGQPTSFLMNSNGDMVVFDAGPHIIAFNLKNGTEFWKVRSSGNVNTIDMIPSGSAIAVGTENGIIELYDTEGNLTWKYSHNSKAIRSVALTRDGSKIIAGSIDGKILLLDSAGNLSWSYDTQTDSIRQVAIAADGSLAVAAGENLLYAFSTTAQDVPTKGPGTPLKTSTPGNISGYTSAAAQETSNSPKFTSSTPRKTVSESPTVTMTEYSIVRKVTQSPVNEIICIAALIVVVFIYSRKKGRK